MVAAIFSGILKPAAKASASSEQVRTYHWFKVADLNRATSRRLGQSGAGWTFTTISRMVHHVGRVGKPKSRKAARELGRLAVGLQAIANEAGVSVAKVRRDIVKLVDIGLIAVTRPNVRFQVDHATGRIVENRTGRSLPVVVYLTVGPDHLRTKAASSSPAKVEGQAVPDRDHSGGGIQRDLITKRTPDVDAVGIGTPPASPGGRLTAAPAPGLPAGEAGGHAAAKASQEGVVIRVDAGSDDLPIPIGQISRPAGRTKAPARPGGDRYRSQFPEDHHGPNEWKGIDADRWAATRRREDAERARREAEDAALRAKRMEVSA
jgi:hypothetical protein